jgi:hypothetical protein
MRLLGLAACKRGNEKCVQNFGRKTSRREDISETPVRDGEAVGVGEQDLSDSGRRTTDDICACVYEGFGYLAAGKLVSISVNINLSVTFPEVSLVGVNIEGPKEGKVTDALSNACYPL